MAHRLRVAALLGGAAALTLGAAACSPRNAHPAPAPGAEYEEFAEGPAPIPDLLGAPGEAGPLPPGPQPWPAPEAFAEAEAPAVPPVEAPADPAELAEAPAPQLYADPNARAATSATPPYASQNGVDVIGTPALPRDYARADIGAAAAPAAPNRSAERGPAAPAEIASAAPASSAAREPAAVVAEAEADARAAPRVIAMAPIPNPSEGAGSPRAEPAPASTQGLLGGPEPRPQSSAAPAARARPTPPAPTPAARPPAPRPPARSGPRAQRLAELKRDADLDAVRISLAAPVARASLTGVEALRTGQSGPVSLTLPADLGRTLRTSAEARKLTNVTPGATVSATLRGDGYKVEPSGAIATPLEEGRAPTFTWRVTPEGGRRGALAAEVTTQLGQGAARETLALGEVRAPAAPAAARGGLSSRAQWALAVLLAAVAGLIWWLAREARGDKPRHRHQSDRYGSMHLGGHGLAGTNRA
jgi:hypothetical protein